MMTVLRCCKRRCICEGVDWLWCDLRQGWVRVCWLERRKHWVYAAGHGRIYFRVVYAKTCYLWTDWIL
jgi:hypothetical protein